MGKNSKSRYYLHQEACVRIENNGTNLNFFVGLSGTLVDYQLTGMSVEDDSRLCKLCLTSWHCLSSKNHSCSFSHCGKTFWV